MRIRRRWYWRWNLWIGRVWWLSLRLCLWWCARWCGQTSRKPSSLANAFLLNFYLRSGGNKTGTLFGITYRFRSGCPRDPLVRPSRQADLGGGLGGSRRLLSSRLLSSRLLSSRLLSVDSPPRSRGSALQHPWGRLLKSADTAGHLACLWLASATCGMHLARLPRHCASVF